MTTSSPLRLSAAARLAIFLPARFRRRLAPATALLLALALLVPPAAIAADGEQVASLDMAVAAEPQGEPGSPALPAEVAAEAQGEPRAEAEAPAPRSSTVQPFVGERLLLANRHLEEGRTDDALAVVDELAQARKLKDADLAQIHRFRGYILVARGQAEDAAAEFEKALASGTLDESAASSMTYSLAQLYTQAGRFDRARALLDDWFARAANPKPEAYFLKAMILVQQEDFAAALAPARTAIERSTSPREGWLQLLAAIEFQLQDYAALAGTLRSLVAIAPSNKKYWVQLATIENNLGRDDDALASLGIAYEAGLLKEDREVRQRARACFVHDIPDCCAKVMEEGLASGTVRGDADAWRLLATCRIAGREVEEALEPLTRAAELGDGARSWLLLGQLQLQREAFAEARAALEKALAAAPGAQRPSVELLLGIANLGLDRFDEAERAFRTASADEKTRPVAESYLRHLEQERARAELAKARGAA